MKKLTMLVILLLPSVAAAQTAQDLRTHVEYLASPVLNGRSPGSKGMKKAQEYIKAECRKLGLETYIQKVNVQGTPCYNVIAVLPGRTDLSRVVVGAHLDHIGRGSSGADDNASGCAVLLRLAERLSEGNHHPTIEFHWYTGEEKGLIGSKRYVENPLAPLTSYKVMVNLDMVGRLKEPRLFGQQVFPYSDILQRLYTKYPFAEKATWAEDTGDSDHSSWWRVSVPSVLVHTGLHPDYHRPTDTADKINYTGMVKVYNYTYDLTKAVILKETPFKPTPYLLYGD